MKKLKYIIVLLTLAAIALCACSQTPSQSALTERCCVAFAAIKIPPYVGRRAMAGAGMAGEQKTPLLRNGVSGSTVAAGTFISRP